MRRNLTYCLAPKSPKGDFTLCLYNAIRRSKRRDAMHRVSTVVYREVYYLKVSFRGFRGKTVEDYFFAIIYLDK
ncbi:MAG: hypothetical protein JWO58_617 [Chitinophagaceae bacterium]|nr:hypothetical protein [Chitinophagaceae bacterium]